MLYTLAPEATRFTAISKPPKPWRAVGGSLLSLALPCASGVLLAFPFLRSGPTWPLLIGLVPWGIALRRTHAVPELYFGTILGGLVFHLAATDSLRTIDGGEALGGPHVVTWLMTGLFGACAWCLGLGIGRRLFLASRLPMTLALPIFWVALEFTRRQIPELLFNAPYPWLQLGLPVADYPVLLQSADIAGVWGLSALVAVANGFVHDIALEVGGVIRGQGKRLRACVLAVGGLCIALTVWSYGTWRRQQPLGERGPVVCLLPFWSQANASLAMELARTEMPKCDLLLWPECALQQPILAEQVDQRAGPVAVMNACSTRANAWLMVGCDRIDARGKWRSTAVVAPDGRRCGFYDKMALVPWSEFTPRLQMNGLLPESAGYQRGDSYVVCEITSADERWQVAPKICYDLCFPELFRRTIWLANHRSVDLFAVSSSEMSDRSGGVARSMLQMARCRAVECRRPIVRNVFEGYSGYVDSLGRFYPASSGMKLEQPLPISAIRLDHRRTLYIAFGDWLPIACLALVAAIACQRWWPSYRAQVLTRAC